ncbi:hypothetical protein ACFW04_007353 [Cataglyphis niger]
MASELPEIARMVQRMISLAPAPFMTHKNNYIRYIIPIQRVFQEMMQFLFYGELFQSDLFRVFTKYICEPSLVQQEFCANIMFLVFGYDYEQFNYGIQSGKFRQYDYGRAKNLLIYNSMEPPDYDLANIKVPIALFYANNDWLVSTEDVERLYHLLPNVVDMYKVPWSNFNHVDFLWAKDAPKLVYERVLKIMRKDNPSNLHR